MSGHFQTSVPTAKLPLARSVPGRFREGAAAMARSSLGVTLELKHDD